MIITDKIFKAYLNCNYKSYLKLHRHNGEKTDYEKLQNRLDTKFHLDALTNLQTTFPNDTISSTPVVTPLILQMGTHLLADTTIKVNGLQSSFDALIRFSQDSCLYEPVLYYRPQKITRIQKLLITYKALVLGQLQGEIPTYGHVIYGDKFSFTKIRLSSHIDKTEELLLNLKKQTSNTSTVQHILNAHCDICEYTKICKTKAVESDNLSLLRGMSEKEIQRHHDKGIFSVHQLSYTFRPRKTRKRTKNPSKPHYFALQALAIREKRVYIHGTPELSTAGKLVFFDIEGIPEKNLYYLIGVIIIEDKRAIHRFFWADNEHEQESIFTQFVKYMAKLSNYQLFHYGGYDSRALRQMKERLPIQLQTIVDTILDKSVNILSIIHTHIYFPTYSNRLKDIACMLGFTWTENNASGIQSIIWMELWRENRDPVIKEKLIQYNKEDCLALIEVYNFIIHALTAITGNIKEQYPQIVDTKELKPPNNNRSIYDDVSFFFKDFEIINKCAYFDYQRERVFVRTKKQKKINRLLKKNKLFANQTN
jgi:predicted RecB family nuclease